MSEKDLISTIDDESVIDDSSGVPVLPLRDVVVYPHMVIPLFVGRERSIVALNKSMDAGKRILLVAQKAAALDDPQPGDLYEVGTLATILQLLKLPDDDSINSLSRVLGIDRQLDKLPGLLSAGERQRAAFARALSHRPSILIADEPTSALDPVTAQKIMAVVMEVIRGLKITLITASHDWAHVYKMELRTLKQEAEAVDDGKVYQSRFTD